jgi:hypothetical protein
MYPTITFEHIIRHADRFGVPRQVVPTFLLLDKLKLLGYAAISMD